MNGEHSNKVEVSSTDRRVSHTPGPWSLDPNHPLMVYCDDALGSRVADLSHSGHGISIRQDRANARLVAAAPELLASLKEVCDWIAYCLGQPDTDIPDDQLLRRTEEMAARARAIVDKAEGRS